ncbi:MAG: LamG domain-containing protein, partial [Opitutae bacterium]|nr:LamG domain-containing protein [Opitutae bacterium]
GRVSFNLFTDGNTTEVNLVSSLPVLKEDEWVHLAVVYDDSNESNRTAKLFVDGNLSNQLSSIPITGLPLKQRYSALEIGGSNNPFNGIVDDVRIYDDSLNINEISQIYGLGGGDFKTLEIVGAGTTKLTARQSGNDEFAPALPVYNYLTVLKTSQNITFGPIVDQSVGDFPFELDANSSSGLGLQFATSDPAKATIHGSKVFIHGPGNVTITALQHGDSRFNPAVPVDQNFTIGYGNLFSDSAPGLKLWFDANDVNADNEVDNVFDFISGKRVSMWGDKSGNTNNPIQATVNLMPTWNPNMLNNKPVMEFDSSSNPGESFVIQSAVPNAQFIFIVHRQDTPGISTVLGGDLSTTNPDGLFRLEAASGGIDILSEESSSNWSVNSMRVIPDAQSLWINGKIVGSDSDSASASALDKVGDSFDGGIAEVLVYDESVNSVNRQKVEGYLAHKWGLTSILDPIHPYSTTPPSFGGAQTISFSPLVDKASSDSSFPLTAVASSGLSISYVSSNPSVAMVVGNIVTITGVGSTTITAMQLGDDRFHPADPVSRVLSVIHPGIKDDQIITFELIPEKVRDDPAFELNATAVSSGINHSVFSLPVTFIVNSGPASVNSVGVVTLDGLEGNVSITARQSGSAYVNPAPEVTQVFYVSSKQRQEIRFPLPTEPGGLRDTPRGHRPLVLQGVRSTSGIPLEITSSDPSVARVFRGSQIIPLRSGSVELLFNVPGNNYFVAAQPVSKTLNIIDVNKTVWRQFRKGDVRYLGIQDRFLERALLRNPFIDSIQARKIFNEDYTDSDGDGYSNLFERAIGADSLAMDRRQDLPYRPVLNDNRPRISFVRFKEDGNSTINTAGEIFHYHVEQSDNLQTWSTSGVEMEKTIYLGGGMERQTWVLSQGLPSRGK